MYNRLVTFFFEAFAGGLLAIFTPYVYAIFPVLLSYINTHGAKRQQTAKNSFVCAFFIILIFMTLGFAVGALEMFTHINRFANHWLFNLIFFRIFIVLGLSFLGMFEINVPEKIMGRIHFSFGVRSIKELFYLSIALPAATFSSTGPIVGLLFVVLKGGGLYGPVVAMLGFSLGFGLPFIFPGIINFISKSINWLNQIRVILGFFSLVIALKFLSNTDLALNLNIISDQVFIAILILLAAFLGIYMLGYLRLTNDYLSPPNQFNQTYVSILHLMLSIAFFSLAVYLLPGMWGAPVTKIAFFLPHIP